MDLRRQAVSLRKAAEDKFGVTAKIKTGSRGDFTVLVNGKPVFKYKKEGTIPPIPELLDRIQAVQN
jgi:predicted Rdx family selenoprotein